VIEGGASSSPGREPVFLQSKKTVKVRGGKGIEKGDLAVGAASSVRRGHSRVGKSCEKVESLCQDIPALGGGSNGGMEDLLGRGIIAGRDL